MSWSDAWPSREDQRATTLAMKLGGRRLVARRHSGVDVGVCGDGYRQIRPSVAGSCLALACGRRRGGGEGVAPPWRRSAGASVMPSCGTTPVSQNPDCHLKQTLAWVSFSVYVALTYIPVGDSADRVCDEERPKGFFCGFWGAVHPLVTPSW